jgi:ParB/RepB/Spo0J family partition protein
VPDGGAVRATERTFADIELPELFPMATNPRKLPTDPAERAAKVADIVVTIEADEGGYPVVVDGKPRGIREPLCVRRRPGGGFDIIKGERRYRAAQIAGLRRLTCEIVEMTDEQVLEEQLVEDGARVDLTPLEEAAALARLREEYSLDIPAIGHRTGKTERLVRQRLVLHDHLVDEGKALLADCEISIGLALQIAALGREAQGKVVAEIRRRRDGGTEPLAAREIQWILRDGRRRLVDGGFPLDDAELVPKAGACTTCPKNSATQRALFLDGAEDGQCGDAECFTGKRAAMAERAKSAAKTTGVPFVGGEEAKKKIFPHGSYLLGGSPFVNLDEECRDFAPPRVPVKTLDAKSAKRGGPEKCPEEDSDGKHDFFDGGDAEANPHHDAAKAGCSAWSEGWKPPTWRQALEQAKTEPPGLLNAQAPDGKVWALADKKGALAALRGAGLLDRAEVREPERGGGKKPGQLDKYQLDRKAEELAFVEALGAIDAKARKKAVNASWWRWLAGLVLRAAGDSDLEAIAKRRGVEPTENAKRNESDACELLLEHVAAEKNEEYLRGLTVEVLAGVGAYGRLSKNDDSSLVVAARFLNVDLEALEKDAKARVTAEAKAKAKEAADKAKKKASPKAPKPAKAPPDLRASILAACAQERTKTQLVIICKAWPKTAVLAEVDKLHGEKLLSEQGGKYSVDKPSAIVPKTFTAAERSNLCGSILSEHCERSEPPFSAAALRVERVEDAVLFCGHAAQVGEMAAAGELTLIVGGTGMRTYEGPKPEAPVAKLSKAAVRELEESAVVYLAGRSMTEEKLLGAIALSDEYDAARPVLRELVTAGKLVCFVEGDVRTYSLPPMPTAPTRKPLERVWALKGLAHLRDPKDSGAKTFCGMKIAATWGTPKAETKACEDCIAISQSRAPADDGKPFCKGCGCNDKTACIPADGGECKLEGDVCSVCTETGAQVLRVCAKPIGDAALAKKLGDVEPHRLAGVVKLLLERGKLKRDDKKKLVAAP